MTLFVCNPDFLREYLSKINSFTDESIKPYIDHLSENMSSIEESSNRLLSKIGENTAFITIQGVLRDVPSFMSDFFGYRYTTYGMILDAIDKVKNDSDIEKVILEIDSPGGYVSPGLDQVWLALKDLRSMKQVIAVNKGMMASGAYWIASAANEIYSVNELTQQGSIGVYQAIIDYSEMDKRIGIREIRIVSAHAPLKNLDTNDPRLVEQVEKDLNFVENIFLSRIAEGRSIPINEVIENFGQGGLVQTDIALKVRMIDKIIQEQTTQTTSDNNIEVVEDTKPKTKDNHMLLSELMTSDPSVNAEVETIKKSAYDEGYRTAKEEITSRVTFAVNYVTNEKYNEHVRGLALGVIKGDIQKETLEQVVSFFDKESVKADIEAARKQSEKIETTTTEQPPITEATYEQDGKIRSQSDIEKAREARNG